MGQDPLFATPARRKGSTERAAERTIKAWRADGLAVDPLTSSNLRGAAADVDRAVSDHGRGDAGVFPITRARALLAQLAHSTRPATGGPDGDDALDDAITQLLTQAEQAMHDDA